MNQTTWIRKSIGPLLVFLVALSTNLYAQDISTIYRNSKSSIVLIVAYDKNKTPLGMGTGFYFRKNLIATNYHVVEGASSFLIKNIGSGKKFYASNIKSYSEKLDIALIGVTESSKPVPIANEKKQSIGDKVVVIGNPRGLEGSVSSGIISGIRPVSEFYVYQLTAAISPGSSGGPVFDVAGNVIGIATFTIRESQNLNFAMPASLLAKLEGKKMKWEPAKNIETVYKRGNAGIELVLFKKKGSEFNEQYSLKNTTQNTIKNLSAILLYYKMGTLYSGKTELFHYRIIHWKDILPPGLAKMKTERSFDQEQNFVYFKDYDNLFSKGEIFRVGLRVLSYDIIEEKRNDIFDAILKQ